MSKTPMETMLDAVDWRPRDAKDPYPEQADDGLPYATHEGMLNIGGYLLRVYRLSNGQAVINADDFRAFFGGPDGD